jgi:uridylate kinase
MVRDATAVTLCRENSLPIMVFNMTVPGNVQRALSGELIGTLVH